VIEQVSAIGPFVDVHVFCPNVDVVNSVEQSTLSSQRDYSFMLDDITDIADLYDELQVVHDHDLVLDVDVLDFPESIFSNASPAIGLNNDFIPSVEDVDESLFTFESAVVPDDLVVCNNNIASNNSSNDHFGTATAAELENVKRGGIRRSEASKRWTIRSFNDWRRIRGLSIEKTFGRGRSETLN
jgi:hypothetical protein